MKKGVHTCETCNALYVCLKFFQEHRKKHADIYPCTHCQEFFTTQHQLNFHMLTHSKDPPHSCDVCNPPIIQNSISQEEILGSRRSIGTGIDDDDDNLHEYDDNMHEVEQEEEEEDSDSDETEEDEEEEEEEEAMPNVTNIICITKPTRPSRSMGKGKGNRKARATNDGDANRKFSCCHCGKFFKTKSHLQRHILTHTGEKPYHCNVCDNRFNQSSSLRNHVIAIHTKKFPHTCNNCGKGFLMPALYKKHRCGATNQVVEDLQ